MIETQQQETLLHAKGASLWRKLRTSHAVANAYRAGGGGGASAKVDPRPPNAAAVGRGGAVSSVAAPAEAEGGGGGMKSMLLEAARRSKVGFRERGRGAYGFASLDNDE